MPLYEYQCDACGHRFEVIQKFSDLPVDSCDKCGGAVRKLLSSPAIQFKGSGWYITDYARAGKADGKADGKGDGGATAAPSGSGSSAEAKSEAKAEPKPESKPATSSTSS